MKTYIKYTQNFNLKLNCAAHTTFRLHTDPAEYQPGKILDVYFKAKNGNKQFEGDANKYVLIGQAEIVSKQLVKHKEITDAMAVIDVGHKSVYLQALLKRMYATKFAITGVDTIYERLCLMYTRTYDIPITAFIEDQSYYIVKPPIIENK